MIRLFKGLLYFLFFLLIFILATVGTIGGDLKYTKIALLLIIAIPAKKIIQNVVFPYLRRRLFA